MSEKFDRSRLEFFSYPISRKVWISRIARAKTPRKVRIRAIFARKVLLEPELLPDPVRLLWPACRRFGGGS